MYGDLHVGEQVRVVGKRGRFRVVGLKPDRVELLDGDEKWHAVRPERVIARPVGKAPASPA